MFVRRNDRGSEQEGQRSDRKFAPLASFQPSARLMNGLAPAPEG